MNLQLTVFSFSLYVILAWMADNTHSSTSHLLSFTVCAFCEIIYHIIYGIH